MNENTLAAPTDTSDREIVITRLLNAPPELVYKVWTQPEHVAKWWGPKGFTDTIAEMEVKPGGVWRHVMHGPDGVDYPTKAVFLEVDPPKRLVYWFGPDNDSDEGRIQSVVTFEALGDKTFLTMRAILSTVAQFEEVKKYAVAGGESTIDCLEAYLAELLSF